jgi:hypothetical protein
VAAELKQASFLPPPASAFYQQASRHSVEGGISLKAYFLSFSISQPVKPVIPGK